MEQFFQTEGIIIGLLLVVALVAMIVRRLRIPYIVTLVAAGLFLTLRSPFHVELTPELILTLFVRRWSSRRLSTSTLTSCAAAYPAS